MLPPTQYSPGFSTSNLSSRTLAPSQPLHFQGELSNHPAEKAYPKPKAKKWFLDLLTVPSKFYIRYRHNILNVSVRGQDKVIQLLDQGHHLILTPNHPGHGDTLMTHPLYRAIGRPFNIIVADFFFNNHFISEKWRHRILNARGMFPLNREIPDKRALTTAIDVVKQGKYPLVIFPEGISTGQNDRLGELKEGTGMIALTAATALLKEKPDKKVFTIPVAMRHHFTRDITSGLYRELNRIEFKHGIKNAATSETPPLSMIARVERVARKAVERHEKAVTGTSSHQPDMAWEDYHQQAMSRIADTIGHAMGLTLTPTHSILDKHRDLTGGLKRLEAHSLEVKKTEPQEFKRVKALKAQLLPLLSDLYEMLKFSPTYLTDSVTPHRLAEALYRIDAIRNNGYSTVMSDLGPRVTVMEFDDPIDVTAKLTAEPDKTSKVLRKEIIQSIRTGLEAKLANGGPKP